MVSSVFLLCNVYLLFSLTISFLSRLSFATPFLCSRKDEELFWRAVSFPCGTNLLIGRKHCCHVYRWLKLHPFPCHNPKTRWFFCCNLEGFLFICSVFAYSPFACIICSSARASLWSWATRTPFCSPSNLTIAFAWWHGFEYFFFLIHPSCLVFFLFKPQKINT